MNRNRLVARPSDGHGSGAVLHVQLPPLTRGPHGAWGPRVSGRNCTCSTAPNLRRHQILPDAGTWAERGRKRAPQPNQPTHFSDWFFLFRKWSIFERFQKCSAPTPRGCCPSPPQRCWERRGFSRRASSQPNSVRQARPTAWLLWPCLVFYI